MRMKDKWIQIRVSESEKKEIQEEASKIGLTVASYLMTLHKSRVVGNKIYKKENK